MSEEEVVDEGQDRIEPFIPDNALTARAEVGDELQPEAEAEPAPRPKRRKREGSDSKVTLLKVMGPKYSHQGEQYLTGRTYDVSPDVADFLLSVRGQHGERYFVKV